MLARRFQRVTLPFKVISLPNLTVFAQENTELTLARLQHSHLLIIIITQTI
uniref:Uncharacterized protein n=1 Tax=Anguilla anguilla TaxID=7936 RepID=A0A0E9WE03_ANGAN